MSEMELGGPPACSSVSLVARGSASTTWSSSYGVDSRVITSSVCFPVELELSKYTTSMGLSFWFCLLGEFCFQMRSRGVDLVLLGPGIVAGSAGEFIKSLASEDAAILKVGPEGVSQTLNVLVKDDCTLLGVALMKDLFSDELVYKSFLFSNLACRLYFKAAFLTFAQTQSPCCSPPFCFCHSGWALLLFVWPVFFGWLFPSSALPNAPGVL